MKEDKNNEFNYGDIVAENIDSMLAYWDQDLICRFANNAYRLWFGKTKEQMINKIHIKDFLGEDLFASNKPYIDAALNGQRQRFERELVLPNGIIKHSIANYYPHIVGDRVVGFVAMVTDITDIIRKREGLENKLKLIKDSRDN